MMRDTILKLFEHLPPIDRIEADFSRYPLELESVRHVYEITRAYASNSPIDRHVIDDRFAICDGIKDHLWEIINTGHYGQVEKCVRQLYTLAVLQKVVLLSIRAELNGMPLSDFLESSVWELDNGILIGYPLDEPEFRYCLNGCLNVIEKLSASSDDVQHCSYRIDAADDATVRANRKCDIAVCQRPSIELFRRAYFDRAPVILQNCMDQWPALDKWNQSDYLLAVCRNRIVPIEIGQNYSNENWSQQLMKFEDFFRRQMIDEGAADVSSSTPTIASKTVEYLAQHNLFEQIPLLKDDIITPEYCCITADAAESDELCADVDIKAWLGPKGTISPMHYDNKQNLLCQVFGTKRIILARPEDTHNLYPHDGEMLHNTSQIDAESLDFEHFPRTANVKFYELTLCKGEMLYIPSKWWHYVRSLSKSFSVSFWWE